MTKDERRMLKKANELKDNIVDLLHEADIETGLALTVLVALSIDAGLNHANIPPHELIRMLAQSVCRAVEAMEERDHENEEEGEDDEQVISRTTH